MSGMIGLGHLKDMPRGVFCQDCGKGTTKEVCLKGYLFDGLWLCHVCTGRRSVHHVAGVSTRAKLLLLPELDAHEKRLQGLALQLAQLLPAEGAPKPVLSGKDQRLAGLTGLLAQRHPHMDLLRLLGATLEELPSKGGLFGEDTIVRWTLRAAPLRTPKALAEALANVTARVA